MKRFEVLLEKALTPAQQKAHELGLKYRGFGYWQDPKTGKTAYKTQGDELVPIDHENQMELDGEEEGIEMGDPLAQEDPQNSQIAPPGSNVLGAPEPGKERPSRNQSDEDPEETGWDPGPDGDNMVNDQNKPEDGIPNDTYVGSNNNLSWVAGPDGSNFKNLSFDNIIDEALSVINEVRSSQRTQGAKELNSGLNTRGAELLARNKRQHDPNRDAADAGHTNWWKPNIIGDTRARQKAKEQRGKQQEASNQKHRREIGIPTTKKDKIDDKVDRAIKIKQRDGGGKFDRTSYWKDKKLGFDTKHAQDEARHMRHMPNQSSVTRANRTEFWKKGGQHNTAQASAIARDFRAAVGRGVDHEAKLKAQNDPVPKDLHDEIMGSIMKVLKKDSKSYTGAETKISAFQKAVNQNYSGSVDSWGSYPTEKKAAKVFGKLNPDEQKDQMDKLQRGVAEPPSWAPRRDNPRLKALNVRDLLKNIQKVPQLNKDKERVKKMNDELKELLSDPSIDLDVSNLTGSGGGAFGTAYLTPDQKNIIKSGKIGHKELIALHKLKDSPYFPTLMNAMFETPFTHQSSYKNNPQGETSLARAPGNENYPFSRDSEDWPIPTARGTFAMSRAAGRPFSRIRDNYSGDDYTNRVTNIWKAREALHRAGISHNDMHGSNIFMDDDGNPTILDFGLANDDPMTAFQEALAGYRDNDYQLASGAGFENLPDDIQDKIRQNYYNLQDKLRARLGLIDDFKNPNYDSDRNMEFDNFMRGGIRMKDSEIKKMREKFDFTDDELLDYIGQLYDGLTPKEQSELEKRMSSAYDQRVADNEVMGRANAVRANRGAPPIPIPRNVVPSKNLDRGSSFFGHDD